MKLKDILNSAAVYGLNEEYDIFIDEYLINEGLIKTWPIEKTISILRSHKIECDIFEDENVFHAMFGKVSNRIPEEIFALVNNMGWFPSYVYYLKNEQIKDKGKFQDDEFKENYEKYDEVMIRFEAKYDIRIEKIPRYLYHVTSRERGLKIMTLGLIPKAHSIASNHPERIYLGRDPDDLETMIRTHPDSWKKSRDGKFTILKINTQMIPRYFQIYNDPNGKGHGVFTLNTIPKSAIDVVRTFDVN